MRLLRKALISDTELHGASPIHPQTIHMTSYLESIRALFKYYQGLGAKAMVQLEDEQFAYRPEPESNNIATIVKHLHGNMLSRWTDFLTSDGEKAWRHRDQEFDDTLDTKEKVLQAWDEGWACLFNAMGPLEEADLERIVYIRNEGHTVLEAINRQLGHYSYHVGQIVFLAKQIKGTEWQSLSIPKGGSKQFNEDKFGKDKGRRHFA